MLSYRESFDLINDEITKFEIDTELVNIKDAHGRSIAEDIYADINLPPFNNSAVDGLAIKFTESIRSWKISSEVSAGNYNLSAKGESAIIMTGAKVPPEFDTVIPLEDYTISENRAVLRENVKFHKGMNIRVKASDVSEGEIVVSKGTYLNPRNIAVLASCGKDNIQVYKKLKFAILATGDELISIKEKPSGDKIRVSNNYSLSAAVESLNQDAINCGYINDDYEATLTTIKKLLKGDTDILITTGGVSVGKYDFIKDILVRIGVDEIFWKAFIKPGKPIFFGKYKEGEKSKLIFGLPGNPVSCMVNFDVYIKPCIIAKYGLPPQTRITATLLNSFKKLDLKRHFVRGNLIKKDNNWYVTTKKSQSSGNLVGLSSSNCLVEIPEEILNPIEGTKVECIMM